MMTTKQRFTVTVKRVEWVPCKDGLGHISHPLPATEEVVEVTVDLEGIAQSLGPKACRSKGKRAQAISGLVVVRKV